jgi:RsiW-degrading membrane proteinase PrsW (M82 family)
MQRTWYCLLNGCEIGPLSSHGLCQLAANGQLQPNDLVRSAAKPDWHPARQLKGLEFPQATQRSNDSEIGWYFRDGTVTFGPYSAQELIALGALGLIRPADYIRRGANGDWLRADRIKGMRLRSEHPTEARRQNVVLEEPAISDPVNGDPVTTDATVTADPTDHSDTTGDSDSSDDSDAVDDSGPTGEIWKTDRPNVTHNRWKSHVVTERFLRIAKSVGLRLSPSQRDDALLATFVILPCTLPTFGPSAGGLTGTVVAFAACAIGLTLFYKRWKPIASEYYWGMAAAAFIAVFGVTTLLQFTDFSMAVSDGTIAWDYGPLWLVKGVGSAYRAATEHDYSNNQASFVELIIPTILSVGIFEEALKLLPALVAFATRQVRRPSGLLFIGAASGLAFGMAEGVWMLCNYPGELTLSMVIVRLLGGAACHAVMTSLAVMLFLALQRRIRLQKRFALELMLGMLAAVGVAGVHGLYDSLLAVNLRQAAGLLMSTMVIVLLRVDRRIEPCKNMAPQIV